MSGLQVVFLMICFAYVVGMTGTADNVNNNKEGNSTAQNSTETGKSISVEHIPMVKVHDIILLNNNLVSKTTLTTDTPETESSKNKTTFSKPRKSTSPKPLGTDQKLANSTQKSQPEESKNGTQITSSEKPNIFKNATTSKKHKLKPTKTVSDEEDEEEEVEPLPPTTKTWLHDISPKAIDYIVPVTITIICLPVLMFIMYVGYKRGRDYWDKRHYKRMDFLIDGMYNE